MSDVQTKLVEALRATYDALCISYPLHSSDMDKRGAIMEQARAALAAAEQAESGRGQMPQTHKMVKKTARDLAEELYAEHPTYRGTKPMPWREAPKVVQREWIDKASALLAAAPEAPAQANNLTAELQQRCSDWGVYWRAPDAHGVVLTVDQATELLRDALGVEVEVKAPAQAAGEPVAFEFYNPSTGHAIVDYSRHTHIGPLTKEMGYEARPLGYIAPPQAAVNPGGLVPLWQAREALESLEESARGDAPYNHFAASLVRSALEQATTPPTQASDAEDALVDRMRKALKTSKVGELAKVDHKLAQAIDDAALAAATPALLEIRKRESRLSWLHSPESHNVDGYEWGIYRVKWENGRAVEVLQTLSDFSDLDAAIDAARRAGGEG